MHSAICDFVKGKMKVGEFLNWAKMLQNFVKCDSQISYGTVYVCVTVRCYIKSYKASRNI
jgi:hypothetical protein